LAGALLQAGADLEPKDLQHDTALDLALRNTRKPKAAAVLKQWTKGKIRRFMLTGLEDCEDVPVQQSQTRRSHTKIALQKAN
jgi:hypothetical protein